MMEQGLMPIMQRAFKYIHIRADIIILALLLLAGAPGTAFALNCVQCHDSINFKGRYEHTPVQNNECDACHSLHVSRHPGLLLQEEAQLCSKCHADESTRWDQKRYSHTPVRQGECTACHAPHASAEPGLLIDAHADIRQTAQPLRPR
jgi:predicted CXXCH cytochrome family protein